MNRIREDRSMTDDPAQSLADLRAQLDQVDAELAGDVPTYRPRAEIRTARDLLVPQVEGAQLAVEIAEARRLLPEYGAALERFHALRGEIKDLEGALSGRRYAPGDPAELNRRRLAAMGEMQELTSRLDVLRAAAHTPQQRRAR
jgi:hypothetical protein